MVSSLADEVASARTIAWLAANAHETFLISAWTVTELSAALSVKRRRNELSQQQQRACLLMFNKMRLGLLTMHPIKEQYFFAAAEMANRSDVGLRAGDALHLAICADGNLTLATLDKRLHRAGISLGLLSLLLEED